MDKIHKSQYVFLITSRAVLLRIRNVSDIRFLENKKKIVFSKILGGGNHTEYEITCENIVKPDRPQMTKCRMRSIDARYLRLKTHTQNM